MPERRSGSGACRPAVQAAGLEELAVNLWDLGRVDPGLQRQLFYDRSGVSRLDLRREAVVRVGNLSRDTAVPIVCPLLEAALTCDALRAIDRKAGDRPTRVYWRRSPGPWQLLPQSAVLTRLGAGGAAVLDSGVFRYQAVTDVSAPTPARVEF